VVRPPTPHPTADCTGFVPDHGPRGHRAPARWHRNCRQPSYGVRARCDGAGEGGRTCGGKAAPSRRGPALGTHRVSREALARVAALRAPVVPSLASVAVPQKSGWASGEHEHPPHWGRNIPASTAWGTREAVVPRLETRWIPPPYRNARRVNSGDGPEPESRWHSRTHVICAIDVLVLAPK
jgi:hypothetical protein